jgi:hypothetical protein
LSGFVLPRQSLADYGQHRRPPTTRRELSGFVLTCQSRPISASIVVDYDET